MTTAEKTLFIEDSEYQVTNLTTLGFTITPKISSDTKRFNGILCLGDQRYEIEARVRNSSNDRSKCQFFNLSIASRNLIQSFLDQETRVGNNELDQQSYDQLAGGSSTAVNTSQTLQRSTKFKSLAFVVMLFIMAGLLLLALVFLRSRSSLSVNNAAMVGNFLPVNARIDGEICDLHVIEGQQVVCGDLLMRLKNPEIESLCIQTTAARDAAKAKVAALENQEKNYRKKLAVAAEKLILDLDVATSELRWARKVRSAASTRVKRLSKYVETGAITQLEYEEAEQERLAADAQVIAAESLMKQIEFSQKKVNNGILILGDRLDDELGRITAELEIAKSELNELEVVCNEASNQIRLLDIKAPRDGQIYSNYRQKGEFLKVAEEAVAISYPGKTWAVGHLTASQASRVRPGQPVVVKFPSLDLNLDGVVLAVGHRAIYSKGGYNADFRGLTASDVPVKVRIEELPKNISSGIRIEMAINTGFGLKWLDDALGFKLKPLNESPTESIEILPEPRETVESEPDSENEGEIVGEFVLDANSVAQSAVQ